MMGGAEAGCEQMRMEEPPGTERSDCHCESSRPFRGRTKVNGKPHSSSSPLGKRNAGKEREREKKKSWNEQDCAHWERPDGSLLDTGVGSAFIT